MSQTLMERYFYLKILYCCLFGERLYGILKKQLQMLSMTGVKTWRIEQISFQIIYKCPKLMVLKIFFNHGI